MRAAIVIEALAPDAGALTERRRLVRVCDCAEPPPPASKHQRIGERLASSSMPELLVGSRRGGMCGVATTQRRFRLQYQQHIAEWVSAHSLTAHRHQ